MRVDVALEHFSVDFAVGAGELLIDSEEFDRAEEVEPGHALG